MLAAFSLVAVVLGFTLAVMEEPRIATLGLDAVLAVGVLDLFLVVGGVLLLGVALLKTRPQSVWLAGRSVAVVVATALIASVGAVLVVV